jgi:hypothetical protein
MDLKEELNLKKKVKSKTLNFRRYFLTIPRCDIGKENIKELLIENEKFLSHYMIGEESHVDNTKHYHIYLKYSKQRDFGYSHFDYLGKHGQLEGCRSPRRSYMYISKEDKNPLSNFDYEAGILLGRPEEISMYLTQTGKKYSDLFKTDSLSIDLLATKWRTLKSWEKEKTEEKKLAQINKVKKGIKYIDNQLMKENLTLKEYKLIKNNDGLQLIVKHLNNVSKYKWDRPFKTKNLLIWSEKVDKGKTSLIRKLMEYCPMYGFPRDQWFHGYKSYTFWGMLWNEITLKGVDVEMLKNFLEGTAVSLDVKGSKVEKEDNPQVFMTANNDLKWMIKDKYRNLVNSHQEEIILNALRARIDEVCIDDYDDIFFLQKIIIPELEEKNELK